MIILTKNKAINSDYIVSIGIEKINYMENNIDAIILKTTGGIYAIIIIGYNSFRNIDNIYKTLVNHISGGNDNKTLHLPDTFILELDDSNNISINNDIIKKIERLLLYNYYDEKKDYEETYINNDDSDEANNHIYMVIKDLMEFFKLK